MAFWAAWKVTTIFRFACCLHIIFFTCFLFHGPNVLFQRLLLDLPKFSKLMNEPWQNALLEFFTLWGNSDNMYPKWVCCANKTFSPVPTNKIWAFSTEKNVNFSRRVKIRICQFQVFIFISQIDIWRWSPWRNFWQCKNIRFETNATVTKPRCEFNGIATSWLGYKVVDPANLHMRTCFLQSLFAQSSVMQKIKPPSVVSTRIIAVANSVSSSLWALCTSAELAFFSRCKCVLWRFLHLKHDQLILQSFNECEFYRHNVHSFNFLTISNCIEHCTWKNGMRGFANRTLFFFIHFDCKTLACALLFVFFLFFQHLEGGESALNERF